MRDDHNENSVAATGIGAVLAGVLSMFARSADDVARMGVHCVDDVGRACVTTSDDIGAAFARSDPCGQFPCVFHAGTPPVPLPGRKRFKPDFRIKKQLKIWIAQISARLHKRTDIFLGE